VYNPLSENNDDEDRYKTNPITHLRVIKYSFELPSEQSIMDKKVSTSEQHPQDYYVFDGDIMRITGLPEISDTGIMGRKSPGGESGEGMADAVK